MKKAVWICIEKAEGNYAAYAPEVLGCVTTGRTIEETKESMLEALKFHLEGMLEDGDTLENITGRFPSEQTLENYGDDYWTLVQVQVVSPGAAVGV